MKQALILWNLSRENISNLFLHLPVQQGLKPAPRDTRGNLLHHNLCISWIWLLWDMICQSSMSIFCYPPPLTPVLGQLLDLPSVSSSSSARFLASSLTLAQKTSQNGIERPFWAPGAGLRPFLYCEENITSNLFYMGKDRDWGKSVLITRDLLYQVCL